MIRTITNMVSSRLFQAHLPSFYWVEALRTATHLTNMLPTTRLQSLISLLLGLTLVFSSAIRQIRKGFAVSISFPASSSYLAMLSSMKLCFPSCLLVLLPLPPHRVPTILSSPFLFLRPIRNLSTTCSPLQRCHLFLRRFLPLLRLCPHSCRCVSFRVTLSCCCRRSCSFSSSGSPLQTRAKSGIFKPKVPFSLSIASPSVPPFPVLTTKLFKILTGVTPC